MGADYENEWFSVTSDLIPSWFYSLSTQDRNTIVEQSQAEYISLTIPKNVAYTTYFENLIAPYNPSRISDFHLV